MDMEKILVLNGPNLDMLGVREPEVYGSATLADLERRAVEHGQSRGVHVSCFQSNSESALIEAIHRARGVFDGIVFNPGAFTHYSYALRDAIAAIEVPVVEVHISDVDAREPFRRISVTAPVCIAQVKGKGLDGYCLAIDKLCDADNLAPLGEAPCDFTLDFADQVASVDAAQIAAQRLEKLQHECALRDLDGILIRDTSNIRWVTAIDGVFDSERAHALLVTADGARLHTDSRYSNAVRSAVARMESGLQVNDERIAHDRFAHEALAQSGSGESSKLGFEDSVSYAEYQRMAERFKSENLMPTSDLVLGLRAVKDAGEITRMRAAQAVTDAAFQHVVAFMKPGMTEREVQLELEDYMVRHGAEGLAFSSIVATGPNGADPHALPGATRLEAGQCVVMDFGAKAFGYCSDMTRMVFLGAPQGTMLRAWETLRRANETVEAALKPGMTGAQAHQLAEDILDEGGFGGKMGHGLGHGVGIDVHEQPVLSLRNEEPLEEGNVVTVEPGIYLPGEFGMRLEDCGVITAHGYDVFSRISHDLVVI